MHVCLHLFTLLPVKGKFLMFYLHTVLVRAHHSAVSIIDEVTTILKHGFGRKHFSAKSLILSVSYNEDSNTL